jgi:hypothetical protein
MTIVGWTPLAGDLERATRAFAEAAEGLDAAALAEAAGRLAALAAGDRVSAWARAHPDRARRAAEIVGAGRSADFSGIEDAAVAVRALLDRRAEGAIGPADLARGLEEPLGARDRIELARLGAAALLGRPPPASPDEESALLVFEGLVRPEVWRLTEANEARRAAVAWMAPSHRPSFWWWSEGADVDPRAVAALPSVAHLAARFPAAAAALRALVAAQETWDDAAREPRAEAPKLVLAAAAAGEEVTILDRPDVQVSWIPPGGLAVDLVADRAPEATPSIRLPGGTEIRAEPVEGAVERFHAEVGAGPLAEGRLVLVLPLAGGAVEILLPPVR